MSELAPGTMELEGVNLDGDRQMKFRGTILLREPAAAVILYLTVSRRAPDQPDIEQLVSFAPHHLPHPGVVKTTVDVRLPVANGSALSAGSHLIRLVRDRDGMLLAEGVLTVHSPRS